MPDPVLEPRSMHVGRGNIQALLLGNSSGAEKENTDDRSQRFDRGRAFFGGFRAEKELVNYKINYI